MPEKGENALIAWLRERFPPDPARGPIGIGDDMAVLRFGPALVAMTADMLLDGVHFDSRRQSFELIGRKAIACSLSDCAAMACQPVAATVSLAVPNSLTLDDVKRLYEGMAEIASQFDCRIVGGDTTSWPGALAIDVAMLAEPMSPRGPIRRCDARPGDMLFVSGPLGGSILDRHLTFAPRLDLARRLAPDPRLHAMMDLSDGLSMDLHRMCEASACNAELDAARLEQAISPAARSLAQTSGTPLTHALNDGEDFELLISGDAGLGDDHPDLIPVGRMVAQTGPPGRGASQVGWQGQCRDVHHGQAAPSTAPLTHATFSRTHPPASETPHITLIHPDGRREPVEPGGYEHWK
jgi:thiamine-monophosphate kinase